MLDSSPVALPANPNLPVIPPRRPLKRSASTASLLTPPRTHRRHARGRSRGSCDSESEIDPDVDVDGDVVLTSDDDAGPSHKKRRRVGEAAEKADEDAFWLSATGAGSAGLNSEATAPESSSKANGSSSSSSSGSSNTSASKLLAAAPLLYRRLLAQAQAEAEVDVAPVSPPPSHRKTTTTGAAAVSLTDSPATLSSVSPPVTPRGGRTTRSATRRALRDSPGNPFLATPLEAEDSDALSPTRSPTASASASSANPSPHTPTHHQEKPTLTYVFRGVRRVYQNPLYNHAANRPYSPPPASKLPLDDPDYSPAIHCTPKLLFPDARRGVKKGNARGKSTRSRVVGTSKTGGKRKRSLSPGLSGDEDDEDDAAKDIRPMKLNFGAPAQTLAQELKDAGEVLGL